MGLVELQWLRGDRWARRLFDHIRSGPGKLSAMFWQKTSWEMIRPTLGACSTTEANLLTFSGRLVNCVRAALVTPRVSALHGTVCILVTYKTARSPYRHSRAQTTLPDANAMMQYWYPFSS